jgi:hypothetical protein
MTMARYPLELPTAWGSLHRSTIAADLRVVCLWSALGLTLSCLMFIAGFGAEIGQALMASG